MLPYHSGSESARALAKALDAKIIRTRDSRYLPNRNHIVICWGIGRDLYPSQVLNPPEKTRLVTNKIRFFDRVNGKVRIPQYTTDPASAYEMLRRGVNLVVRADPSSSGGRGTSILKAPVASNLGPYAEFPRAPLYTQLIEDTKEFRVHIVDGKIIHKQQKLRKDGVDKSQLIRSHGNGFTFTSNLREWHDDIGVQALAAVRCVGLDFGAVDVLWSRTDSKAYVLEVNSAPGIEGASLEAYVKAFKEYLK